MEVSSDSDLIASHTSGRRCHLKWGQGLWLLDDLRKMYRKWRGEEKHHDLISLSIVPPMNRDVPLLCFSRMAFRSSPMACCFRRSRRSCRGGTMKGKVFSRRLFKCSSTRLGGAGLTSNRSKTMARIRVKNSRSPMLLPRSINAQMTSEQSLLANCSERPEPRIYRASSHHKKEGAIETYGRAVAIDGKKL